MKWRTRYELRIPGRPSAIGWNKVTREGYLAIVDRFFRLNSAASPLFCGLITDDFPLYIHDLDTLAAHEWTESSAYDEASRSGIGFVQTNTSTTGKVESLGVSPSLAPAFTFSSAAFVAGAFLCSSASGSSGTLYSVALFPSGPVEIDPSPDPAVEVTVNITLERSADDT